MATESYLQSYIRYACVYSGILCTGRLVKACKMFSCGCTTFLLVCSLLFFLPPRKKDKLLDQVSDTENLAGLQESGQTWSVCVLKEEILHTSTFSRRHFLIRASGSLCQPSKRKSKLPGNVTQSQEPYAMHTLSCQIYR